MSLVSSKRLNASPRLHVVSGVLGMKEFEKTSGSEVSPDHFELPTTQKSLIISILSAGTVTGALSAGYFCDRFRRKTTILAANIIYAIGIVLQIVASSVGLLIAGRAVAGLGVGIVNSAVVLYTGEITSNRVREHRKLCCLPYSERDTICLVFDSIRWDLFDA